MLTENGYQYKDLYKYSTNYRYEYKERGIWQKLVSKKLYNSPNRIVKWFQAVVEKYIIIILSNIDSLRDFKKYTKYNR